MNRIKSWILVGCAASSLFAVAASSPSSPEAASPRFSVTISPISAEQAQPALLHGGVPVVSFSAYHAAPCPPPRDAIATAGSL